MQEVITHCLRLQAFRKILFFSMKSNVICSVYVPVHHFISEQLLDGLLKFSTEIQFPDKMNSTDFADALTCPLGPA